MLNRVMGLRAFPVASALARKDIIKVEEDGFMRRHPWEKLESKKKWENGKKSLRRLLLSFIFLNGFPLFYFATTLYFLEGLKIEIPSTNFFVFVIQILFIGLLSLGVFTFLRFYTGIITLKRNKDYFFYTKVEFEEYIKKRDIYPNSSYHILFGIFYLIPWLVLTILSNVVP